MTYQADAGPVPFSVPLKRADKTARRLEIRELVQPMDARSVDDIYPDWLAWLTVASACAFVLGLLLLLVSYFSAAQGLGFGAGGLLLAALMAFAFALKRGREFKLGRGG